jgi:hypothetical protein
MTIAEIRARFPHPRSAEGDPVDDCDYCCGGAIFLATLPLPMCRYGYGTRFPSWKTLAYALRCHNPNLKDGTAGGYARAIIQSNDREHFEMAWSLAAAALEA